MTDSAELVQIIATRHIFFLVCFFIFLCILFYWFVFFFAWEVFTFYHHRHLFFPILEQMFFTAWSAGLQGSFLFLSEVFFDNNIIVIIWSERWERGTPFLSFIQNFEKKWGAGGGLGWVSRQIQRVRISKDGWGWLKRTQGSIFDPGNINKKTVNNEPLVCIKKSV